VRAVVHGSSALWSPRRVRPRDAVDASCARAARLHVQPVHGARTGRSVTTTDRRPGARTARRDGRARVAPFGERVQTP